MDIEFSACSIEKFGEFRHQIQTLGSMRGSIEVANTDRPTIGHATYIVRWVESEKERENERRFIK